MVDYPGLPEHGEPDPDEPYVEIRQHGRWTYYVTVHDGITQWGPDGGGWIVLGRARAESKARRALAAYRRMEQRQADRHVVRG